MIHPKICTPPAQSMEKPIETIVGYFESLSGVGRVTGLNFRSGSGWALGLILHRIRFGSAYKKQSALTPLVEDQL